jgi:hypothetical protein
LGEEADARRVCCPSGGRREHVLERTVRARRRQQERAFEELALDQPQARANRGLRSLRACRAEDGHAAR